MRPGSGKKGVIGPTANQLVGWWEADSVIITAGKISQAKDKSGHGNNIPQAVAGSRPTLSAAWSNEEAAMQFVGTTPTFLQLGALTQGLVAQPLTVMLVGQSDAGSQDPWSDGANGSLCAIQTLSGLAAIYAGASLTSGAPTTSPVILVATFNGVASSIRANGTLVATGDAGADALGGLTLGAFFNASVPGLTGFLGGGLIFSKILSTSERIQNERYFSQKYGIPITE